MATIINGIPVGDGVNLQPSYFNGGSVNFGWSFMQQFSSIKTVRIEIEPNKVNIAAHWIAEAHSNGYLVIATYHKSTVLGTNDVNELIQAANWWKNNYARLGGNFIINLMNEWGSHGMSASNYAYAYNLAIPIVRTVYAGDIVIDLPGWGQDSTVAAQAANQQNPLITDPNIVLSAHIYRSSWNGANHFSPNDIDTMMASGVACIVGEFGPIGNGSCNWSACIDYANEKQLTIIGWCWNGDGQGHNMVDPYWQQNPNPTSFSQHGNYFHEIYDKLDSQNIINFKQMKLAKTATKKAAATNKKTKNTGKANKGTK
jgi:mannan endo-1,4-beta-mannosidase